MATAKIYWKKVESQSLIVLASICVIILAITIISARQTPLQPTVAASRATQVTLPSPTPAFKPTPTAKVGFKLYTNDNLRYGFSYKSSDTLYKCQNILCLAIDRFSLRVETLDTYNVDIYNPEKSLEKADLYCSADGPNSSISCKDIRVENYTNSLGFKGYKVYRTKVISGIRVSETYKDIAYVYLLPEVIKGNGISNYAAILFAVDNPTQSHLLDLTAAASTFFIY